jgi:ZIP family zinc transporter
MEGYLLVLALAALPAAGNFLGGLASEAFRVSGNGLGVALHAAAGVVLAVVGLELMPEALASSTPWVPILAFVGGGGFFLALDKVIGYVQARFAPDGQSGPWAIFSGVSLDLFSDGVMIGTGTVVNPALGLLLAAGQVPADIPEGFAAVATLRRAGVSRGRRLALAAAFAIPILIGATLGYFALRSAPELVTLSVLALTGGALTAVVIEEMVPEAHASSRENGEEDTDEPRLNALALVAGFALFAAISAYLGE